MRRYSDDVYHVAIYLTDPENQQNCIAVIIT